MLSATQTWHKYMEDGFSTVCVFLDLAKAFDLVSHQGVIDALADSGSLLVWFCDCLTERSQRVVLQGSSSHSITVPSGVPQGSILGPLLFILTFNGIFNLALSSGSGLMGYADDVTYYKCLTSAEDAPVVNSDMGVICDWVDENKFKLDFEKIKAKVISRKKTPLQPTILLCDHRVEYVESFKLLGVTISNNLSWRPHILNTISKAKRLLGFTYRTFSQGGQQCLSRLYQSIVLPHLDYCSCVWDPPHKTHLKKLESVQSFAARIVTGNWVDSSQALKSKLQWPSLASR